VVNIGFLLWLSHDAVTAGFGFAFQILAFLATCPGAPWISAILAIFSLSPVPKVFSFPLDTAFLQDFPQESF